MYLNYKGGKLNVFSQAYGNHSIGKNINESERFVYTSPNMYYQKSAGDSKYTSNFGYFKVGFDYDFDESNTATFYVNYNGYNYNGDGSNNSFVNNNNNVLQYTYDGYNKNGGANNNLSFYGFYKKKFQTKRHELLFDAMYTSFGNPTDGKMKMDYSNRFEAGYNFTYRTRHNGYNVENFSYITGTWVDSLKLSNLFKYYESINALYATYAHKLGNFDVKFGLRAENLASEGNQITQNTSFSENFLSFFPNLNLAYKLSEMYQLSLNAFRRITYPQIYYINPFRRYLGLNNYSAGNPKIKPTYYNSPMMPFKLPDFISSCYISFNYRYSKQSGQFLKEDLSLINKSYTLNAYLGFKLWWDIDANVSVYYVPRTENRRMVRGEMKYTSLYFSKTMLDRKLRINIYINDIFNSSKNYNESIGGSYYTKSNYEMLNSRSISIGLSYMFNDYKDRRDRNLDDGRDGGGGNNGGGGF